jgi:hypothetical protein
MRRILLSSLSPFCYLLVQSQTFTSEAGLNYMSQHQDFYIFGSFGITYATRANIWEQKNTSLSVCFPLSVGWSNLKLPHFAEADVAGEIDFNFGAGSTIANKKKKGFFVGPGYSYHVTVIHPAPISTYPPLPVPSRSTIERNYFTDAASDTNVPISLFGPTLNAGFRFSIGRAGKIVEFRFSYMKILDIPEYLQNWFCYSYRGNVQKTDILKFGCLFSL